MLYRLTITAIFGLILSATGCTHHTGSAAPTPAVGSFGFNALVDGAIPTADEAQSGKGAAASVRVLHVKNHTGAATASSFNFGNLTSTSTLLFELVNTGTLSVNNIAITTDNPDVVVVNPSVIGVLPTQGNASVIPVISAQVLHGVGANGYGTAPTLPGGAFTFNLTATGTDTNNNTVTSTASVAMFVEVANLEVWISDTDSTGLAYPAQQLTPGIPPTMPSGTDFISPEPFTPLKTASLSNFDSIPSSGWWWTEGVYHLSNTFSAQATRTITIKNTGNVPVVAHNFLTTGDPATVYTISAGGAQDIQEPVRAYAYNSMTADAYIYFDSANVVFSSAQPAAERDGKLYFYVQLVEVYP